MNEKDILIESINAIKDHLKDQEDSGIRIGLYMALETIKGSVLDDGLLVKLGLDEDLEKYI